MGNDKTTEIIEEMVSELLVEDSEIFLVEVKVSPTHNIRVFLDADTGISIEKCVKYNRALYKQLENSGLFPEGDFSLEVSSPGLGEPLKLKRQYLKNTGRNVEVALLDGRVIEGKLIIVEDNGIQVEEIKGKNKMKEVIEHNIPFDNIKTTKIQIQF